MSCQLKNISEIIHPNTWFNDHCQTGINILRPTKSYAIFLKRKISQIVGTSNKGPNAVNTEQSRVCPGDIVKILQRTEIEKILDDWRKYKGCSFMDQMYDYCGKTYKVLKNIDYFYDEARQKLVRCKDIVILEGAMCNGKRTLYKQKCDRNCFLFWHSSWFMKVNKEP
jgi:hypothetical protein